MKPLQGTGIQGITGVFSVLHKIIINIMYINYVNLKIIDCE